jgi:hypothetical protein
MNQIAYDAIEEAWTLTVKARALCPHIDTSAIGRPSYSSPSWYQARGAVYFVKPEQPLSATDVREINLIGDFINRSFIISIAAILEANGVIPCHTNPDTTKNGGKHAQLTKWLRNHFAHGQWIYDASDRQHVRTRHLLEELFPAAASGFVTSIDSMLEPLKDGVLVYIRAVT